MTFPIYSRPVELREFEQAIGTGFSYDIDYRRVRGVILAENRADLDALLYKILPGKEIDPTLYYSLGFFFSEIETPDAIHPDILVIRKSMAQWWRKRSWLYRMNGFMQWQTKTLSVPRQDDEDRGARIRSWFPSLRPELDQDPIR